MLALAIGLVSAALAVQERPADASAEPKRGDTVVVRGCITGGMIESSETEVSDSTGKYTGPVTYRLTGDKKLLKQLKDDHDGHADVLTGVLKSDLPNSNTSRGKRIGNTRITIGVGEAPRANPREPQYMPVLQVKELEHSGLSCRR